MVDSSPPSEGRAEEGKDMTVHRDHTTRTERLTLIAAAVRGVLSGASQAFVVWLIKFLAETN
ncbi:hypothetical protein GCM10012280_64890 [Wenjunlia tyrosinilytica]|uniref:Uncharacterized protein n=1 Tax=Wenjunlia tyrosinilytica TaxID=1544741 RepID=A0A917ZX75_9ACTN|nr:hypothetical protein GCM10012280_64890 [Wenjunlia tyrosinilytica]